MISKLERSLLKLPCSSCNDGNSRRTKVAVISLFSIQKMTVNQYIVLYLKNIGFIGPKSNSKWHICSSTK